VSFGGGGLAALVALIWGVCFVLIQASLPSSAPLLLAGLRALIGGVVLVVWLVASPGLPPARGARPDGGGLPDNSARPDAGRSWRLPSLPTLVVLALANAAVAFGAMYLAAGRAEAAVASILAGGQPLVLAAAGWALFGERTSRRTVAGLLVAMAGVTLVATTSSGATTPDGVALALLATVAPAAGTVVMRRLGQRVDLETTTAVQFLLGGVLLVAASALVEPWDGLSWSSGLMAGLLVLGVLGTGLAYVAWFGLLARIPLARLGAALFLVPVTGVVAGILTGDRPATVEVAGIAIVLAGLAIVSLGDTVEGRLAAVRARRPS